MSHPYPNLRRAREDNIDRILAIWDGHGDDGYFYYIYFQNEMEITDPEKEPEYKESIEGEITGMLEDRDCNFFGEMSGSVGHLELNLGSGQAAWFESNRGIIDRYIEILHELRRMKLKKIHADIRLQVDEYWEDQQDEIELNGELSGKHDCLIVTGSRENIYLVDAFGRLFHMDGETFSPAGKAGKGMGSHQGHKIPDGLQIQPVPVEIRFSPGNGNNQSHIENLVESFLDRINCRDYPYFGSEIDRELHLLSMDELQDYLHNKTGSEFQTTPFMLSLEIDVPAGCFQFSSRDGNFNCSTTVPENLMKPAKEFTIPL